MAEMDFDRWFAQQGQPAPNPPLEPVMVKCCCCGRRFEADYVESEEEAEGMDHWCNGSDRCCP
jgi:hypothetical protein